MNTQTKAWISDHCQWFHWCSSRDFSGLRVATERMSCGQLDSSFLGRLIRGFLVCLWLEGRQGGNELETEWSRRVSFTSSGTDSCQQGKGGNCMLHTIQQASQAFLHGSKDPRVARKVKSQYTSSFHVCMKFAILSLAKASHTVKPRGSVRGLSKGFDKLRYELISS